MNNVEYIVVGCGLAGIAFCEQLRIHDRSFAVIDNSSQQSSIVAAGLYNPVILKRFSEVWNADQQLKMLKPFYRSLESLLEETLDYEFPIYRRFASIEEQNNWFEAADNPKLEAYLSTQIITNTNTVVDAPYGFGEVLEAGRIDTSKLIEAYKKYLKNSNRLLESNFVYNALEIDNGGFIYDNLRSTKIVFTEGFGLKQNPFFNHLPLNGTKGEVLVIKSKALKTEVALKAGVFLVPLGNDVYKVGATYNWEDKTNQPSKEGEAELVSKLKSLIKCDFEIIDHKAGIRPTVKDRRPLVGRHDNYKNMYVFNGLGTRGVMIAPYIAPKLYSYIEEGKPLEKEIDCIRFNKSLH